MELIEHDTNYDYRYYLVFRAIDLALQCGYLAGIRIDPEQPEWPVAFIEITDENHEPAQISWHIPQHIRAWDEHTTEEKFARIHAFCGEDDNHEQ